MCVYPNLRVMVCSFFIQFVAKLMTVLGILQGLETCKVCVSLLKESPHVLSGIADVRMFETTSTKVRGITKCVIAWR